MVGRAIHIPTAMASSQAPVAGATTQNPMAGIDAAPRAGQSVSHEGQEYTTIREGLAHILVPHGIPTSIDPKMSKEDTQRQQVFYNPIQQFNRDLSVLAIKTFGEDLVHRRWQKREQARKKGNRKRKNLDRTEDEAGTSVPPPNGPTIQSSGSLGPAENANEQLTASLSNRQLSKKVKLDTHAADDHAPNLEKESVLPEGNDMINTTTGEAFQWKPAFKILDALSATGLRALRYAQEIPFSTSITANDMSSKATETIALNVKHNKLEDKIRTSTGNAIAHMYSSMDKNGYDVIDLDPYGTAAPFIDSALQAINDEGLLCVTCTDSAIFASHGYLEKTYSQYGGLPLIGEPCHEGGLRLVLHAIASSAGRYGMAIEPLLSLSIDYYVRVFVRVRKSPNDVKFLAGKTMIIYHCDNGCGSWSTQYLARSKAVLNKNGGQYYKYAFAAAPSANEYCEHCGTKTHLSGPMYGGPLHNAGFIERVLAQLSEIDRETYPTLDRMDGMLHTALEEITFGVQSNKSKTTNTQQLDPLIPKVDPAELDHHPFFFIPSTVAKVLHCQSPSAAAVRGALRRAGFRVTMSHCKPGSIKTDASWRDIWHIMLEWIRQKASLKNALKEKSPGRAIMSKSNTFKDSEEEVSSAEATAKTQQNGVHGNQEIVEIEQVKETEKARPSYLGAGFEVVFDEKLGRDHDRGKRVRYQVAPRENWGPMARAK